MFLSVIIPAYNEAERIGKTLESVHGYLSRQNYEYEIIVVNDGSTDTTADVVKRYSERISHLQLLNNKRNSGKGGVVRQGMILAHGDYRLFMDADNSTTIDHIEKLLPYFDQGYEIVVSSRRIKGAELSQDQSPLRLLLGKTFRLIVQSIVPVGVVDTQNGFKMFTRHAAEKVFPQQTIFHWAFDVEVLALARLYGFRIKEVPVRWVNDDRSRVTWKGMVTMLKEVFQVRLNLWFGRYGF